MRKLTVAGAIALLAAAALFVVAASAGTPARKAILSGAAEVPGPGDPDGTGRARVVLNAAKGEVCFTVRWGNIGPPTAAHIHSGSAGVAGDVVVPLFVSDTPLPDTIARVGGCVSDVDGELIRDIKKNSKAYYVNVHNEEFPGGAIRGQLSKAK